MKYTFIIRCAKCRWAKTSTGMADDLKDLYEIKNNCASCSGRKFRCPKCGLPAKMTRHAGDDESI